MDLVSYLKSTEMEAKVESCGRRRHLTALRCDWDTKTLQRGGIKAGVPSVMSHQAKFSLLQREKGECNAAPCRVENTWPTVG
jgi:hypothetical protein